MLELLRRLYRYWFVDDSPPVKNIVISVENVDVIAPFTAGTQPVEVTVVSKEPLRQNTTKPIENEKLSYAITQAHKIHPDYSQLYQFSSEPEGKVWFYTVNIIGVPVSHPVIGDKIISGKQPGKRYSAWASIPSVVRFPIYNVSTNAMLPIFERGEVVAKDVITPINWDKTSIDTDLSYRGLFWSLSNPPKEEEILAAEKKLKLHFKMLLQKTGALSRVMKPAHLLEQITEEHHAAAEYFNVTTVWHPITKLDEERLRTIEKDSGV